MFKHHSGFPWGFAWADLAKRCFGLSFWAVGPGDVVRSLKIASQVPAISLKIPTYPGLDDDFLQGPDF